MTSHKTRILIAAAGLAAISLASSDTMAFGRGGGGSDYGDSYLNDSVKNPRFIEPYADQDPARYRAYHHREAITSASGRHAATMIAATVASRYSPSAITAKPFSLKLDRRA